MGLEGMRGHTIQSDNPTGMTHGGWLKFRIRLFHHKHTLKLSTLSDQLRRSLRLPSIDQGGVSMDLRSFEAWVGGRDYPNLEE